MVGSVAGRTMLVPITEVGGQHVINDVEQVGIASRPRLNESNSGGGVRTKHLDNAIALARNEPGYLGSDVDGLGPSAGTEFDDLRVQGQTV